MYSHQPNFLAFFVVVVLCWVCCSCYFNVSVLPHSCNMIFPSSLPNPFDYVSCISHVSLISSFPLELLYRLCNIMFWRLLCTSLYPFCVCEWLMIISRITINGVELHCGRVPLLNFFRRNYCIAVCCWREQVMFGVYANMSYLALTLVLRFYWVY